MSAQVGWTVAEDGGDTVVMCGPIFIATVHEVRFDASAADANWGKDDNARLIAAVPDLLEALRWYAGESRYDFDLDKHGNTVTEATNDAGQRARAAIAKATGA